jgi:hypothetical protein
LHKSDLTHLLLGFLVARTFSPSSKAFWSNDQHCPRSSRTSGLEKVQPLQFHLEQQFDSDESVAGVHWDHDLRAGQNGTEELTNLLPAVDGLSCLPDPPVVEMVSIVARFTITEPGIERAFSGLDKPD